MASEMSFENVDDDGQQMPAYTISSPMSLWLRSATDMLLPLTKSTSYTNMFLAFGCALILYGGARWLSGRVSDSGARGPGFETYRRRVVSLSKTLYSPKVLVNYPGSDGSVPT